MPRALKKPLSSSTSRLVISVMGLLQPATTTLSALAGDWAWLLKGQVLAAINRLTSKPANRRVDRRADSSADALVLASGKPEQSVEKVMRQTFKEVKVEEGENRRSSACTPL